VPILVCNYIILCTLGNFGLCIKTYGTFSGYQILCMIFFSHVLAYFTAKKGEKNGITIHSICLCLMCVLMHFFFMLHVCLYVVAFILELFQMCADVDTTNVATS